MDAPSPVMPSLSATLLIYCPDRKGLVAAVTDFIARHDGNILHLDQHVDTQENAFFMRVEWDLANFQISREDITTRFGEIAAAFNMTWQLYFSDHTPRMAIFVSKESHCLYDILYRHQSGEWQVDIPVIISNHPDMGDLAAKFGIPYRVVPVTKDTKQEAESA